MASSPTRPAVTVAVAAYNASRFIASALASALGQTLADIEIIVVDDCSSDNTVAIVQAIADADARVRVVQLPVNRGPAGARNAALAQARGQWFAMLDSDDLFVPGRLERLVSIAEVQGADLVADNLLSFFDDGTYPDQLHLRGDLHGCWITTEAYLAETRMYGGGRDYGYLKPLIRLDRLRSLGIAYDETLRIGEDDDLVLRMLLAGMRYWLEPTPTYLYRKHAGSISFRLSAANAQALTEASRVLAASNPQANFIRALAQRHRAFVRAQAFAELIDDLKLRRLGAALRRALKHPGTIPLLRMPLQARLKRVLGGGPGGLEQSTLHDAQRVDRDHLG